MPIRDIRFENGVFFAREIGKIERADAETWTEALRRCAQSSPTPVVVLVDAREMTIISPDASKVFNKAAEIENVRVAAIATTTPLATVMSRTVAMMSRVGQTHETHVFNSFEEAERFALSHVVAARS
ncbi:MAG: hypothetical protein HXY41_05920 [Chloroflexi bacterium]|nr:hypothetical protein [Chloroflexota bacterium]